MILALLLIVCFRLARGATEKDALIKAWEENEMSKVENRAHCAIGASENKKRAELKAQLKKTKVNITSFNANFNKFTYQVRLFCLNRANEEKTWLPVKSDQTFIIFLCLKHAFMNCPGENQCLLF